MSSREVKVIGLSVRQVFNPRLPADPASSWLTEMKRRPDIVLHPPPCAANSPITWGELYLLLVTADRRLADLVLERMLAIDAPRSPKR